MRESGSTLTGRRRAGHRIRMAYASNCVQSPQELTGRSRGHHRGVSRRSRLHACTAQVVATFPRAARGRCRCRHRSAAGFQFSRLRPAAGDLECASAGASATCYDRRGALLDHASLGEDDAGDGHPAVVGAARRQPPSLGNRHRRDRRQRVLPGDRSHLMPAEYVAWRHVRTARGWLDAHAAEFGFYRPYSVDRGGVQPEPWHLSHAPVAGAALAAFSPALLRDALDGSCHGRRRAS